MGAGGDGVSARSQTPLNDTQLEVLAALKAALGGKRVWATPTVTFAYQDGVQVELARIYMRRFGNYPGSHGLYATVRSRLKRLEARGLVRAWDVHASPRWALTSAGEEALAKAGAS